MAGSRTMPALMCSGSIRNALRRRGRNHFCMRWMESSSLVVSVGAASKAWSEPPPMPETKVPLFGICLGMQVAIIEYARNVCGLKGANSSEFDPITPYAVIDLLPEQIGVETKGVPCAWEPYPAKLRSDSLAFAAYGTEDISERHRHRYEVNNKYRGHLENAGLIVSGQSPDGTLVE